MKKITFLTLMLTASALFGAEKENNNTVLKDSLNVHQLDQVEVKAFRTTVDKNDLPYSVTLLTAKDLKSIPVESASAILKSSGLVDVIEYQGFKSSVGMRGFSPSAHNQNYTSTFINGVPVGTTNLSVVDISAADGIEVLRGPFSSFYGSGAMGGVVNISTKKSSDKIGGNFGISGGSFNTYKLAGAVGGAISEKFNFDANIKFKTRNSDYKTGSNNILKMTDLEKLILDDSTYGVTFDNSTYDLYNGGYRLGYNINDNISLNFYQNLSFAKDIYLNGNIWGSYGSQIEDITNTNQSLHLEGKSGNHSFKVAPFYNTELTEYYNDTSEDRYINSESKIENFGFIAQDQYNFSSHSLVVGLDNTTDIYSARRWGSADEQIAPYNPDNSSSKTGIYAQLSLNLLDNRANIVTGLRYDHISLKVKETDLIEETVGTETHNVVNPNLAVQYKLTDNLRVKGGVGRGFLSPDAFQKTGSYDGYYTYKGNPDLDPESSISYEFGASYTNMEQGIEVGATYFTTDLKDKIGYDYSNEDYVTYLNADNADMDGIELNLAVDFGRIYGKDYTLKLYGNLTHMIKYEITSGGVTSDILYIRKNNGSFGLLFDNYRNFSTRLNSRYIGHRESKDYLSSANRPELYELGLSTIEHPDALVFDYSAEYRFAESYNIGLEVNNLFDENYTEKDGYNMPGRSIFVSLGYKF